MTENNRIVPGFDEETSEHLAVNLQMGAGKNNCLVVTLTGSVDSFSASCLRRSVLLAIDLGFTRLVFDLRDVDYVASMGIGVLIALQRAATEKGGGLTLSHVQPKVMTVFKLMHIDSIFQCIDSVGISEDPEAAGPKSVFPRKFKCLICEKPLIAATPGKFRCPHCKGIVVVNETGKVSPA